MKNMIFIFVYLLVFLNASIGQDQKIPDSLDLRIKGIVNEHYYSNEYIRGLRDANKFYKPSKKQGNIVVLSSIINPLLGLVPVAVHSKRPINENELGFPNEALMDNADYYYAYIAQAKKINKSYLWKKWGNGSIAGILIVGAVILTGFSTTF